MSSTPAGWYDDGSGRQRWWDGAQWTDQFMQAAPAVQVRQHPDANRSDTIWSAVGKPLTGIGAGRYRLTSEYLFFEKGTLSTKAQQIRTNEIHDVDASQTLSQKARGVGNITLIARRTTGDERVLLEDVPDYRAGVNAINEAAHEARERLHLKNTTQHVNYTGLTQPAVGVPQQPAPAAAGWDVNTELAKLAAFRQSGVLDEEEFQAAKRKLLGL